MEFKVIKVTNYGEDLELDLSAEDGFYEKDCASVNGLYIGIALEVTNNSDKNASLIYPSLYFEGSDIPAHPTDKLFCERDKNTGDTFIEPGETETLNFLYDVDPDIEKPMLELYDASIYGAGFTDEILDMGSEDFGFVYISLEGSY